MVGRLDDPRYSEAGYERNEPPNKQTKYEPDKKQEL